MKQKIIIGFLCIALVTTAILAGTSAASAAETKAITENMDSIQQQLVAEKITLTEYTQSTRNLNRMLENKKLDEVKATVTYGQALSVREAYRITQKDEVQMGSVGNAILQG